MSTLKTPQALSLVHVSSAMHPDTQHTPLDAAAPCFSTTTAGSFNTADSFSPWAVTPSTPPDTLGTLSQAQQAAGAFELTAMDHLLTARSGSPDMRRSSTSSFQPEQRPGPHSSLWTHMPDELLLGNPSPTKAAAGSCRSQGLHSPDCSPLSSPVRKPSSTGPHCADRLARRATGRDGFESPLLALGSHVQPMSTPSCSPQPLSSPEANSAWATRVGSPTRSVLGQITNLPLRPDHELLHLSSNAQVQLPESPLRSVSPPRPSTWNARYQPAAASGTATPSAVQASPGVSDFAAALGIPASPGSREAVKCPQHQRWFPRRAGWRRAPARRSRRGTKARRPREARRDFRRTGDEAIIQELRQNLRQDVQDILHSAKEFVVELGHFALKTFDRLPLPGKRLVHSLVDRYLVRE